MITKTMQFVSRFALPPNSLGYCGKDSAPAKFKKCIISGECDEIQEELKHFIVLYPYLKTISKITGQPLFSYQTAESYWLGNEQLEKVKFKDYDLLLKNFTKQGVPDFLIKELEQKIPKVFIPTHLFQVLHVGVGKASGSVPYNIKTINQCMIRWGKVKQITKKKIIINLNSLVRQKDSYQLILSQETLPLNIKLIKAVKTNDTVAVHWQQLIKIITVEEEKKMDYWTRKVITEL